MQQRATPPPPYSTPCFVLFYYDPCRGFGREGEGLHPFCTTSLMVFRWRGVHSDQHHLVETLSKRTPPLFLKTTSTLLSPILNGTTITYLHLRGRAQHYYDTYIIYKCEGASRLDAYRLHNYKATAIAAEVRQRNDYFPIYIYIPKIDNKKKGTPKS